MSAGARSLVWIAALSLIVPRPAAAQDVEVRVVDVGAGLCTITTIPGDIYMVYDAGFWSGQRCLRAVEEEVDGEVIDLMIISHSDSDHLGDADDILAEFDVQRIIWTGHRRPGTANWDRMNEAIAAEARTAAASVRAMGSWPLVPGESLSLGPAVLTLLAGWDVWTDPGPTAAERRNAISVVVRLEYDGKSILYAGDTVGRRRDDPDTACKDAEALMVANHDAGVATGVATLRSDVLLAPHHGGNNGSSACFIDRVNPTFVIFSAGHDNDHPTAAAANRYLARNVPLANMFRTDRGDDEGGFEWSQGRIPGCSDPTGDDDVLITLPLGAPARVRYAIPTPAC